MLFVLKRTVSMRRFFEHTKYMFKLIGNEINAILGAKLSLPGPMRGGLPSSAVKAEIITFAYSLDPDQARHKIWVQTV